MPAGAQNSEPAGAVSGKDNLFLWTVFLLLLAGVGFACWLGSFYIFGHPEQPRPYRLLTRLGKITPPTRFLVTKAPPGEFFRAQKVFEQYSKFSTLQLEHENELLIRNYIKNYAETKRLVPYLTGKFTILRTYELQNTDLITSGVVALAQSDEYPQLLVELIYPTPSQSVVELRQLLQTGLEVHLEKTLDLSAILHVGQALDGRLQVTTMPLLYGNYALKNGVGTFSLEPPPALNVGAGFPLVRGEEVRSVMREQLELKRRRMASKEPQPAEGALSPQLVRLDLEVPTSSVPTVGPLPVVPLPPKAEVVANTEVAPQPVASPTAPKEGETLATLTGASNQPPPVKVAAPEPKPATPLPVPIIPPVAVVAPPSPKVTKPPLLPLPPAAGPVAGKAPSKLEVVTAKVEPVVPKAEAVAQNTPNQRPAPVQASTTKPVAKTPPAPVPAPSAPIEPALAANVPPVKPSPSLPPPIVEPKPFVAAAPSAVPTGPTGSWKTYNSGQQPGGRVVSTEQATALAGRNDSGRLYLRGQFVVTATGNNRAVLRQTRGGDDRTPPARVIVEYPAGAVPPSQGSSIARDDGRGFEIREVRKSADGQVNIFVREVTSP